VHVLPTLWFRNTWSWGRSGEGYPPKPRLQRADESAIAADHVTLGRYRLRVGPGSDGAPPPLLFTENETNQRRLFDKPNASPYVKDAFHERV
ncbi:MAG: glucosidase, partial [Gammaproteobacteria bacterium]|nr:glucosidase [Gammaproteobacteria bacterium]